MINNILKLPIVKFIAMIALLYYIFNQTKNDPRSIASKINKENFSKSVNIIKQNINTASQATQNLNQDQNNDFIDAENVQKSELIYQDIRQGIGGAEVICGSEVEIEYSFINKNNNDITNKSNMKFDIGSKFNEIIEKALIGMTAGGVRVVDIPKSFKTGDLIYDKMIQNSDMIYKILLLKVSDQPKSGAVCYE